MVVLVPAYYPLQVAQDRLTLDACCSLNGNACIFSPRGGQLELVFPSCRFVSVCPCPKRKSHYIMAVLAIAYQLHEMFCHDLEGMATYPGQVELWMRRHSVNILLI